MGSIDNEDLDLLKAAGAAAAETAMAFYRRDPRAWSKDGGSPVSEADIAVDKQLAEILSTARPDYGWLSEETADGPDRLERERIFVIDPIDGTRGFLEGNDQWTVSLAVIENGRPITAVLVAPAQSTTYWAVTGEGAFRDGERLSATSATQIAGARFSCPRRYARFVERETDTPNTIRFVSSLAHRTALVAAGEIDVAIARPGANDWDLAAGDLLVQEAGARLTDTAGRALRYNTLETGHSTLIATTPSLFDAVVEVVNTIDRQYRAGETGNNGGDRQNDGESRTATSSPGIWRGT